MPIARANQDQSMVDICSSWPFGVQEGVPDAPHPGRIRRVRTTIPSVPRSGSVTSRVVVPEDLASQSWLHEVPFSRLRSWLLRLGPLLRGQLIFLKLSIVELLPQSNNILSA